MRKVIAWLFASPIYAVGDICCFLCDRSGLLCRVFFRPYQACMRWSAELEAWAGTEFFWKWFRGHDFDEKQPEVNTAKAREE